MATNNTNFHVPVLLKESIDGLDLDPGKTYFDATLGNGGHAEEVWRRYGNTVKLAGIDTDPQAVEIARERLELLGAKTNFIVMNFRKIVSAIGLLGIEKPDAIMMDLGWNKLQFEGGNRGFSFERDEPLLMTFGKKGEDEFDAADIVNTWEEENLKTIIAAYGEEKFAGRIARAIVERREEKSIKTSKELAEIIKSCVPVFYRFAKIHPATRTFQALRIAVNDELRALEEGLEEAFGSLKQEGRLAVISFHSLEDRIVKNFFKEKALGGVANLETKKPIVANEGEIERNRRSRSAKLRIISKITQ